jgi:hypothetical protein
VSFLSNEAMLWRTPPLFNRFVLGDFTADTKHAKAD